MLKGFIGAAALIGMVASGNAWGAMLKSYDFDTGFGDTLGNGNALTPSGGTLSGGRYTFSNNQGLRLTDALGDTSDYGIEIKFQLSDSVAGFNKVIDFQDLGSDIGLYVFGGSIDFFTAGPSAGSVPLGSDVTLGLARSAGAISVFLNSVLLFSATDSGQAEPGGNILNFFEDDFATSQGESFAGSVDFIRIHDDASTFGTAPSVTTVPLPAALPLLAVAFGGFGFLSWRRSRSA